MHSMRSAFFAGAAISLMFAVVNANASNTEHGNSARPLLLAQAADTPESAVESTTEKDPVSVAQKAVNDARAELRHEMATGGDVRGARRNLQTAIKNLNTVKAASEDSKDTESEREIAEVPILAAPPTGPVKTTPPIRTLDKPQNPAPSVAQSASKELPPPVLENAAPSNKTGSTDVPRQEPLQRQTPAQADSPAATTLPAPTPVPSDRSKVSAQRSQKVIAKSPSARPPALPVPGAPLTTAETDQKEAPQNSETSTTETATNEPPENTESQTKTEAPGFFSRLFGGRNEAPETAENETAKLETPPSEVTSRNASAPSILKKLPPLKGPKVVSVSPDTAKVVKKEDEKRVIVKENGQVSVKHDDNDRFRRKGEDVKVEKGDGGTTVTKVTRGNGTQIITVRDTDGDILQRSRKRKNGEVDVLIGNRDRAGKPRSDRAGTRSNSRPRTHADFARTLPKLVVPIPQSQYIIGSQGASRSQIQKALVAPPVEAIERPYALNEIKGSERLRAKLRRIDVDTVTFEFGAATIAEDQVPNLQAIGNAMATIIADDPSEVFFIEGHTDAVGSDLDNLTLSDQRAESIAEILSFYFNIPPENLVTQGYGEQYLKVLTAGPERINRRASVRRITPLLVGQL